MDLYSSLKKVVSGDVEDNESTLFEYSHDASLFEVKPKLVIFPKDEKDVQEVVKFVSENKKKDTSLSITCRSGGTDMSGGSINDSIILAFSKYFNDTPKVNSNTKTAITKPGVYYRDFERETVKEGLIFPSYPASREICAMGGIVNNNSGGEKSLYYGKTEKYVKKVKVVLRDGSICEFSKLSKEKLKEKMKQPDLEGEIYREMHELISKNYEKIMGAKPDVSKNSAGYFLWNVYDKEQETFDLSKLWVGAQGTLGVLLEAKIELVPMHMHREMIVIFLDDLVHLGEIISSALPLQPESFESYDDNTLKLALKYFPEFAKKLGVKSIFGSGIAFLPEFLMVVKGGLPKLVLQIDFTGNDPEELKNKVEELKKKIAPFHPKSRIAVENQEQKYWLIRRESFNLLRQKIRNKHTAPFIDDFVIKPQYIAEVIPQVTTIIKKYKGFVFTVAGHVGDGNFHIIPLVDIKKKHIRDAIPKISEEVYGLIIKYKGSITGEHNDGLIRTPYLKQMYGPEIYKLFEKTKEIFDPENIFNPRKKVGGTLSYAMQHLRLTW